MKKIIAMVLAVAMIAALGVSAFAAESKTARHSYDYYWNKLVDDNYGWKGDIRNYAAGLSTAKSNYNDAKDAFDKAIKALPDAQSRVIYQALTQWYGAAFEVANVQFHNALEETFAKFQFELAKDVLGSDFVPGYFDDTYATGYELGKGTFDATDWRYDVANDAYGVFSWNQLG